MSHRFVLVVLMLLAGPACSRNEAPPKSAPGEPQPALVLVAGDATAADVAAELRKRSIPVTEDRSQAKSAAVVLIAQDVTTGLLPLHAELVQEVASVQPQPKILWVLTRSALLDDQELLELEELEARELLNKHGLPGDTIAFAVDDESAPFDSTASTLKGWNQISRFASQHGSP